MSNESNIGKCKICGIAAHVGWFVPAKRTIHQLLRSPELTCLDCAMERHLKMTRIKPISGKQGYIIILILCLVIAIASTVVLWSIFAFPFFWLFFYMALFGRQGRDFPEPPERQHEYRQAYKEHVHAFHLAQGRGNLNIEVCCSTHHEETAIARCIHCGAALCAWCLIYQSMDNYTDPSALMDRMEEVDSTSPKTPSGSIGKGIAGAIMFSHAVLHLPPAFMDTEYRTRTYSRFLERVPNNLQYLYTPGIHQLVIQSLAGVKNTIQSFHYLTFACVTHEDIPKKMTRRTARGNYLIKVISISSFLWIIGPALFAIFTHEWNMFSFVLGSLFLPGLIWILFVGIASMLRSSPWLGMSNPLKRDDPQKFYKDLVSFIDVMPSQFIPALKKEDFIGKILLCDSCGQLIEQENRCRSCKQKYV